MRVSAALLTGIWVAALCPYAPGQNSGNKEAQIVEAKGIPPRSSPKDYPAQGEAGSVTIAAEFMGHSVPRPEGPLSTEDFVVVETGLFGAADARLKLSFEDFSLRINGKKAPLPSQPFGLVASSLRDPEWVPPGSSSDGKSKTSLHTGGDGNSNMPPPPVHIPIEMQRAMAQYIQKAALPEGDRPLPQAGLLFFSYHGKTQNIRSLELIYSGPAGKATLNLQP